LVTGRWVRGPGETVITRSFARDREIVVGSQLTALGTRDVPALTVVGEVIDVDPNPDRGWVSSGQVGARNPTGATIDHEMAYRFRSAATSADIQAEANSSSRAEHGDKKPLL